MSVPITHRVSYMVRQFFSGLKFGGGDEKTLVNYDELDEYTEEGDRINEKDPRQRNICDRCQKAMSRCQCSTRCHIALLSSLGFLISFGIRCNMGVAIIQMTNKEEVVVNQKIKFSQEFDWNPATIGLVDSSFFWGYIVTQIPGGYLASRYPANRVFGIAIAVSACLNLLIPGACKIHYVMVMVVRILQGLVEGVTYPACHGIWRHWAPPLERSKLATLSFCGSYAGAVLGMPLSAILTRYLGWQSCFYFYGIFGMMWFVGWFYFSSESPATHKYIDEDEVQFIQDSMGEKPGLTNVPNKFLKTPWKKFLTSPPVYAIIVANFCRSWSFYLLIITQPKYFKDAFGMTLADSGVLSALPHLLMTCVVPFGGFLADYLRRSNTLSTTNVRKIFNCGGFGLEACFLLGVAYTRSTSNAIVFLTIAVGVSGFAISGFNVNHLDIAPRYASILMGMSNGVGTFAGMICPIVTEMLTTGEDKQEEWQRVFVIASIIHFAGVTFYAIFASGEKQEWAEPPDEEEPAIGQAPWPPQNRSPADGSGGYNQYSQYNQEKDPEEFASKMMTYGTTNDAPGGVPGGVLGGVPGGAPVYATSEEMVQEPGRDPYMNGDMKDRNL